MDFTIYPIHKTIFCFTIPAILSMNAQMLKTNL
jgi:hypothetical protein